VLSGFLAAIIVVVFTTLLSMAMKQNPIPDVYKVFDQQGYTLPPEAEKFLKQISDEYSRNGFSITLTLVTLVMDIIIYPIMGAIGGMLAVIVVGKKKDAAQQ
jgi:type II secretory pathway component PulF